MCKIEYYNIWKASDNPSAQIVAVNSTAAVSIIHTSLY